MALSVVSGLEFNSHIFTVYQDTENVFWFHGLETCKHLEMSNTTESIQRHVSVDFRQQIASGKGMPAWFIQEPGLYQLIFAAKSQQAERFRQWVFKEVLPAIRKTGSYQSKAEDQQHFTPFGLEIQKLDSLIDLAKAKGLEPSQVIDLHKQLTGQSDQSQEIMPSPNGGGKKPRDYQVGLRRTLNLARSRGMVTAREVQQMKYFNDKAEIIRGFRELQAQGLGKIEISHNGTSIKFHPAPVPVAKG
jgi:prophage antirepressor-like protein